ncbi:hypothetical protein Tco_0060889 [Tanacetum coccineum]
MRQVLLGEVLRVTERAVDMVVVEVQIVLVGLVDPEITLVVLWETFEGARNIMNWLGDYAKVIEVIICFCILMEQGKATLEVHGYEHHMIMAYKQNIRVDSICL